MIDDVVINKKETIERCIRQIREYYASPSSIVFEQDFMRQDAIAINLQRASEACIDIANHCVRLYRLGVPKESREGFILLQKAGIISSKTAGMLSGMIGFRNTLVHEYQELNISIMKDVVENRLDDLVDFTNMILSYNPA